MKKIGNKKTLQSLIEECIKDDVKKPDEFTSEEFYHECLSSGKKITMWAARSYLSRWEMEGKVTYRKGRINGRVGRFYKIVK